MILALAFFALLVAACFLGLAYAGTCSAFRDWQNDNRDFR